ncbi:MAG: hypothetical protein ACE5JA_01105 [bacterium]
MLYLADASAGLRVIDVSMPTVPIEIGYYDTPGDAECTFASGSLVYVADGRTGIQVYDNLLVGFQESDGSLRNSRLRLLQNPVRGDYIRLRLELVRTDNVALDLYDVCGQRVTTFSFFNSLPVRIR